MGAGTPPGTQPPPPQKHGPPPMGMGTPRLGTPTGTRTPPPQFGDNPPCWGPPWGFWGVSPLPNYWGPLRHPPCGPFLP